jgi:hypothetical protein
VLRICISMSLVKLEVSTQLFEGRYMDEYIHHTCMPILQSDVLKKKSGE